MRRPLEEAKMPPFLYDQTTNLLNSNNNTESAVLGWIKCVLVGDGAVGKTSLVISYTTNGFPTEYVPTAYDNYKVIVTVDSQPIGLQLCDTAGQDDFDSLRPLCYPGADVFLLCFSVVSPTSFANIRDKWLPEIRRCSADCPLVLVGTQCDLRTDVKVLIELARYQERPVSEQQAKRLAQQIGASCYLECSALTQRNMKEVFDTAILVGLQRNNELGSLTLGKSGGQKLAARNGCGTVPKWNCALNGSPNQYYPGAAIQSLQTTGNTCRTTAPNGISKKCATRKGTPDSPKRKWKKFLCLS